MTVDEASLNQIHRWSVPSVLTGNIFIYGRPGSGKSVKMMTLAQGFYEKGFKIWDIFGGKRDEGPFWSFPSDDYKIWAEIESETNEFKVPGPKQYPVRLLYPMFSKTLPRRLPNNPPNVTSRIFTIPIHDLQEHMEQILHTITGPLSSTSVRLWDKVIEHTKPNDNGQAIKELFNEKMPKKKDDKLYDTFIRPAIANHLLSSENCELNLDWVAEAEDKSTITVLCLDYVPEKFKLFIMAYVMKKLFYLVKDNQIPKKNLALFREASLFMKVVDADASKEDSTSVFRNIITDIARYCRSGLYLILDSQDSCLDENTYVITKKNGKETNIKIKNLNKISLVYSYNFNKQKYEWVEALKLNKGKQDCYEIELEDGKKVIATANHKFFHKNGSRTCVSKLNIGDDIVCREELEKK